MPRLLVHVEGQTEETFVNELLPTIRRECPHFGDWLDRLEQLPDSLE